MESYKINIDRCIDDEFASSEVIYGIEQDNVSWHSFPRMVLVLFWRLSFKLYWIEFFLSNDMGFQISVLKLTQL